jgi:P27 family predicted phage terminase small subunit
MAGRRGPKPRPTALRKLTASPTSRKKNVMKTSIGKRTDGRPPSSVVPDAMQPKTLPVHDGVPDSCRYSTVAALTYRRLLKDLKKMRILAGNDLVSVEALALAYARAIEAEDHVTQNGVMIRGAFGWTANPAVAMARAQWQEVRKWSIEFGLTPSSRTRVAQIEEANEDQDGVTGGTGAKESVEKFLFGKHARVVGAIGS